MKILSMLFILTSLAAQSTYGWTLLQLSLKRQLTETSLLRMLIYDTYNRAPICANYFSQRKDTDWKVVANQIDLQTLSRNYF